jgi:hypothetical protein
MVATITYDINYIGRNLNGRVADTLKKFHREMMEIRSNATKVGGLNSSRVYIQYWTAGLEVLRSAINEAAQFAYNYSGQHTGEVYNQVAFAAKRMVEVMMDAITAGVAQKKTPMAWCTRRGWLSRS